MLIFVFIFLILFSSPISAQSFDYQLKIVDNFINLDFFEIIEETPPTEDSGRFLSFDYQLSTEGDLPLDLPLFLVTLEEEVLFYADQSLADNLIHKVTIDTAGELPIFYKNTFIKDFKLELSNFHFTGKLPNKENLGIKNLLVIREKDQSLTVLFSVDSTSKTNHSFELFCSDNQQSTKLTRQNDFLWPDFSFQSFLKNHQQEFIFHLDFFECDSSVYLLADGQSKSDAISIIKIEDL